MLLSIHSLHLTVYTQTTGKRGHNASWQPQEGSLLTPQEPTHSWRPIVVQSLNCVRLFVTPWTAACKAFLSFTISWSLLKLMSIDLMMPFSHLILCCPLLLPPSVIPSIRVFSNASAFISGEQSIGASASASVLPLKIQD